MKHFVTRASMVLGFVWIFFSLSAFADCFQDGFNAGLGACTPSSGPACDSCCPTTPDRYEEGKNDGLAACPAQQPCNCSPDDYKNGYNAGFGVCPAQQTCQLQQTCNCPTEAYNDGYNAGTATCDICQSNSEGMKACLKEINACDDTKSQIATYVNENCKDGDNCGITIATEAGKKEGRLELAGYIDDKEVVQPCIIDHDNDPITPPIAAPSDCQNNGFETGVTKGKIQGVTEGKIQCLNKLDTCIKDIATNKPNDDAAKEAITAVETAITEKIEKATETSCTDEELCDRFTKVVTDATQNAIKKYCGADPSLCFDIKDYCGEDPSRCFDQISTVPEPGDDTCYDNKKKNCLELTSGIYLSSVDFDSFVEEATGKIVPKIVKNVRMDFLIGGDSILFLLKKGNLFDSKKLVVKVTGIGEGKVFSDPMGIICDKPKPVEDAGNAEGSDCEENYETSTKVELYAVPTEGSVFDGWICETEDINGILLSTEDINNPLSLTMDNKKDCTATFKKADEPITQVILSITVEGSGSVTANDKDCSSSSCSFDKGTKVTLTTISNSADATVTWKWDKCEPTKDTADYVEYSTSFSQLITDNQTCRFSVSAE
ncbi:MAG: hypothetical protein KAI83_12225 [Thiomargarita sp.]|nr:hypothetical protein [Thiomargarita sp.]